MCKIEMRPCELVAWRVYLLGQQISPSSVSPGRALRLPLSLVKWEDWRFPASQESVDGKCIED